MATHLDLAPDPKDMEVFAGTDNTIEVTLLNATTSAAIDITSDDVKFTAKDALGGSVVKIATKTNSVGEHSDPTNGKTRFQLTKEELVLATATAQEAWWYEVRRVISGSSDEVVYMHGQLRVKPSVGTGS